MHVYQNMNSKLSVCVPSKNNLHNTFVCIYVCMTCKVSVYTCTCTCVCYFTILYSQMPSSTGIPLEIVHSILLLMFGACFVMEVAL